MRKEEITCGNCEAEFFIEHEEEAVFYCPFCAEEFTEIEHEDPDLSNLWDE